MLLPSLVNTAPGTFGCSRDRLSGWLRASSIRKLIGVHHGCDRSRARDDGRFQIALEGDRSSVPLHVRSILHAERKMYAQLRVLFGEILHAFICRLGASTRAHVDRPSEGMARGLGAGAGSFLSRTDAGLFLCCAMRRCDRHRTMCLNKSPEEYGSCLDQWTFQSLDILFLVGSTVILQGRRLLFQRFDECHCRRGP